MLAKRNYKRRRKIVKRFKRKAQAKGNSTLTNIASIAGTALKTAMFVKSLVNVEYKYFDQGASLGVANWNGSLTTLCAPAQGVGALQRTGDSIKMKNLTMRYAWERNPSGINNEICRIVIFIDKENSITTGAQFFQSVGTVNAPFQSKFADNKYDSKILYDKLHYVDLYHPVTVKSIVINIDDHCHFDAGTTTIDKNAIKFLIISQTAINGPQFTYNSRVTYIDN